jgi:hypothetical protein
MFSIKDVKTQVVALALAGTVALSSVLGSGVALANSPNLAPNPSFETVGSDFGWVMDAKGTDALLGTATKGQFAGDHAVWVYASEPANQGWPGFTTEEIIPVDSNKEYTFSASYTTHYGGLPWMDMALFDAGGKHVGSVSTGTSSAQESDNTWHEQTYNFKPELLKKYFGDIAGVKLGLKLSLNYGFAGIEEGTFTAVIYDDVKFEAVAANEPDSEPDLEPDLVVTSISMGCCWYGSDPEKALFNTNGIPVFSIQKQWKAETRSIITFNVKNVGTADVTGPIKAATVKVTKDGVEYKYPKKFTVNESPSLSPGQEVRHEWWPSGWKPGLYTLQVMVDHSGQIDELDEGNNLSEVIEFEIVP